MLYQRGDDVRKLMDYAIFYLKEARGRNHESVSFSNGDAIGLDCYKGKAKLLRSLKRYELQKCIEIALYLEICITNRVSATTPKNAIIYRKRMKMPVLIFYCLNGSHELLAASRKRIASSLR